MPSASSVARDLFLLSLALVLLSASARSQQDNLKFEPLPLDQGASTHVSCIVQDRIGFIWVATWSGLYRYDGYSFVAYKHDAADTTSLADNLLSTLYEDKAGNLWGGSWLGLEKFEQASGTFRHFTPNPRTPRTDPGNNVSALCEDKNGTLWVGSWGGLYRFDKNSEKFAPVLHDSSDPGSIAHNSVGAIHESNDGSLWFGTAAGLDRYDFETGKFEHCLTNPVEWRAIAFNVISAYWITSIVVGGDGILWLGTQGGLVAYDPRDGTTLTYQYAAPGPEVWPNPRNSIRSISRDNATGTLWVSSVHGLFTFDEASRTFARRLEKATTSLCVDRSGTLLLGTDTGLQKRNAANPPFRTYPMGDIAFAPVAGKPGVVWVCGYSTGWHKFDMQRHQFVPYSFGQERLYFVHQWDRGGYQAFLAPDGSVNLRDTLGHVKFRLGPSSREFNTSLSVATVDSRGCYFGTFNGGVYHYYFHKPRIKEILNLGQAITLLWFDNSGRLWISTLMGRLVRYDPALESSTEYVTDPKDPLSWTGKPVTWFCVDSKGTIWFATADGLERLEHGADRFTKMTERDGLLSNNVRGIAEDDHGYLWVSTTKGISRFDPGTGRFKHYDASYGLEPPADVFMGGIAKASYGEMVAGAATGVTVFHPDSIRDNPFVPPIVITSFKKFDKPSPLASEIHLPYDENFLSFEFAALSYVSPERNQYKYMMEGVDKDWVYSGTRRYASYPNLSPGEYVFRVKGSNNEGVWNNAGTTMAITISPPWWKSRWAYALYALALLSTAFSAWRMQMRRVRARHELEMSKFEAAKLHEVDELKSRFFANISHEFRTPLTLILGPVKKIIEKTKEEETRDDLKVVHKNARRLLGLVNQLLDISKLESGSMKLRTVNQNIVPLLKALALSFTSYAERKRITLQFTSAEDVILAYIDRDKIEKIFTNILSNAFKFTPEGGGINVDVAKDDHSFMLVVRDTGIGIPADRISKIFDRFYQVDGSHTREQEGTGIGLSLTKELVELHKGTIEVESTEGRGSSFVVRIPLGKGHLKPEEISDYIPPKEGGIPSDGPDDAASTEGRALPYRSDYVTPKEGATPSDQPAVVPVGLIHHEEPTARKSEIAIKEGAPSSDATENPLVLLVEDNADVRKYIRDNVEKDHRILEAVDGEDGWQKSVEHIPDVIVSDVMMPKMDGFALCDRLKNDERTSHIPIILLTAKASMQDKIEGYATGADDYIMKPFDPDEVRARIRNLIEQRKRLHEHFRKHGLFEIEGKKVTPVDQRFLQKALGLISERIADPEFGVETLAATMAVSTSLLLKKIEALVGDPPIELIKRIRLNKAAQLIEGQFGNISEIALEVGFNNPSYFSECFKKQFGCTPSHYRRGPAEEQ